MSPEKKKYIMDIVTKTENCIVIKIKKNTDKAL